MRSSRTARSRRRPSRATLARSVRSATMQTRSPVSGPGRAPRCRRSLQGSGTSRPATGPRRRLRRRSTRGRRRRGPSPLRPACRAPCARTTPPPGAARALIAPPSASTFANALNPVRANTSAEVDQLHPVAEVGLVRSVPLASSRRRSCAGTAWPPRPPRCPATIRAYSGSISAIRSSSVDEAHLDVELGELEPAVGARGLVAEAAHDLVVAVLAAHHQQLLQLLRRLRQRVERARLQAGRHQEVARTLRGAARQQGASRSRRTPARPCAPASAARCGHASPAPSSSRAGAGRGSGRSSRRSSSTSMRSSIGNGGVSDGFSTSSSAATTSTSPVASSGFCMPSGRARTVPVTRTTSSPPSFWAAGVRLGRVLGMEHDLHHAVAIAQVDEGDAAVVAAVGHPAAQGHLGPGVGGTEFAAGVGSHGGSHRGHLIRSSRRVA